jgi:hypothetical protein
MSVEESKTKYLEASKNSSEYKILIMKSEKKKITTIAMLAKKIKNKRLFLKN